MKRLLLSAIFAAGITAVNAQCTELFISEYVEGSGNDKALEIYNPTADTIDLGAYKIGRYSNGATNTTNGGETQLVGKIAPYDVFVITNGQTTGNAQSPACSPDLQLLADQLDNPYPAVTYMNGNDAIGLFKNGVLVDIFGKIGEDPGTAWTNVYPHLSGLGTWITSDHTMRRKATVLTGVSVNPSVFDPMLQYDTLVKNTWSGLGSHTCNCQPLSIKETVIDNKVFNLYPNPIKPSAGFVINANVEFDAIVIYNLIGQKVYSMSSFKSNSHNVSDVNVEKGLYFVEVLLGNKSQGAIKLIVE